MRWGSKLRDLTDENRRLRTELERAEAVIERLDDHGSAELARRVVDLEAEVAWLRDLREVVLVAVDLASSRLNRPPQKPVENVDHDRLTAGVEERVGSHSSDDPTVGVIPFAARHVG